MSENIINIEIKGKSTPVVNITITDSVNISESAAVNPVIKYIATGSIGPIGSTGLTGSVSSNDSVTQANMAANSIGTPEIIDGAITHNKIANNAVYGNNILDNSLAGSKLLNNSIDGSKIQDDSIDASKIANGAITSELLEAGLISAEQIENKSIFGGQIANNTLVREHHVDNSIDGSVIEDDVNLVGTVTVNHLELEGSSPALIEGPSADDINIKTHNQLNIHNTSGNAVASFDQSGNLSLSGTVDGINIATDVAANTLKIGITPSQSSAITNNTAKVTNTITDLGSVASSNSFTITSSDGQNASLSAATQSNWGVMTNNYVTAISSNTAKPDLTVDGAGTVHSNNYTDTVYTHPTSHPISLITGLQTALNAKQDSIGNEDLTIQQTDGLQDALDAKVDDSQVLTNVPSNAVFTDTVYTHPANHAISVITGLQTELDSKQDGIGNEDLTIAMTDGLQDALDAKVDDSQVLTDVPANAVFTDTNTTYSVQDGELSQNNFTDADHTKLNNIEPNATADQTKADIDALGIAATTAVSLTAGNKTIDGDLLLGGNDGDPHYIIRQPHTNNDGGRLYVTAGAGGGTNKPGGSLLLNAGKGTGTASGGSVIFQSSVAGSSGSTVNNPALTAILNSSGTLFLEGGLTVKGDIIKSNAGTVFTFDSSANTTIANTLNATLTGNVTGNVTGNADTATALQSARNIGGVSFNGTASINLPGVNITGSEDTSGNAATATALESAVNIGGVSFDGTSSIDLPGVSETGDQDTSGNAATATALTTGNKNITGTLGVTELITSKQRHLMRCGFYGGSLRMYLPFNYGGTFESTSTSGYSEYGAVIMPCDGYVESIIIRSEQACGNSQVAILVASNGTEVPTLSPGTFASPWVNMAAANTSYKFTGFVNQGGTSNSFSAGDVIMIAFDPTNSSNDSTATAVLVFDWNNQL